jgi:long-chain alkane monooxygenase
VTKLLVPVLQEKGVYKTSYADGTCRDKLFGHARLPVTHPAAGYRGGAGSR